MRAQVFDSVLEALRQAPNGLTVSGLIRYTGFSGAVIDSALQRMQEQNLARRSTRVLWHPYVHATSALEDDVQ